MVVARESVRYAITDLRALPSGGSTDAPEYRRLRLLRDLRRWADLGIDFVQLREKTLGVEEVLALANAAMRFLREIAENEGRKSPKLLVNGRADVAAAAGADGVHLTAGSGELRPAQVRSVFRAAGLSSCNVSISCHTLEEVSAASRAAADMILFGPVFEKQIRREQVREGTGVEALRRACETAGATPVLALGGVTDLTVPSCLRAGAAGVAGIRLFG